MRQVYVKGICWADKNDQSISDDTAIKAGLPTESYIDLDETTGDWSDNGVEQQCLDVLEKKFEHTGYRPELLFVYN